MRFPKHIRTMGRWNAFCHLTLRIHTHLERMRIFCVSGSYDRLLWPGSYRRIVLALCWALCWRDAQAPTQLLELFNALLGPGRFFLLFILEVLYDIP